MQTKQLFAAGERLISAALRCGATGVSCALSTSEDRNISARNGALEEVTLSSDRSLWMNVFVGGREASVPSDSFLPEDLDRMAEEGVAMARECDENEHVRLARPDEWPCDPKNIPGRMKALQFYDGAPLLSAKALLALALELERSASSFPGVSRIDSANVNHWRGVTVRMTSEGFRGVEKSSQYLKSISVIAERGKEMSSGSDNHRAYFFADLRSDEECARRASERAVSRLGGVQIPTRIMPVVFDNRASPSLLRHFFSAISAGKVYLQSTFLFGELGKSVFSPDVTIVDEPHLSKRIGSRLYDCECVGMVPRTLVDHGVLKMWVASIESGSKIGIASTGHASSASNCSMLPGRTSRESLIKGIDYGFLVTNLMGNGNIATGAYSVGAEGFLIEHGQITRPVNKVTIAGNLREMFKRLVPASDVSDHASSFNAPTLLVEDMTVGGS